MPDSVASAPGLGTPEAEALCRLLGKRSRQARVLLFGELVLGALVLAHHLSLPIGIVPELLGPDVPPRSTLWLVESDGSRFTIGSGPFHMPSAGVAWVSRALGLVSAVVVWRWALHASAMNVRLDLPGPGRTRPRRLYVPELLWFGFVLSAVAAACHYVALLWRHSAPAAALGRLGWLPIAWCTAYALQALLSSVRGEGSVGLGLAFWLVALGLGLALIRRIDARLRQRLAWVQGLGGGSAPTQG